MGYGFVIFQSLLKSVGSEVTLGEKVIDLAVYGHPVTNQEILELATERNGVVGSLGKLCIVLDIVKV
jgi:hypothetical protein